VLGVYAFPVFYEFKWEENILNLFIINQNDRICLYCRDFSKLGLIEPQREYKTLFSAGIIGIDNILAIITNTKDEKVDKIKQEESLILLEYGSEIAPQIIYALIVKQDLKSNIYFLKMIKRQFESFYKEILSELNNLKGNEEQLFMSFDIILKDMIYER
jgi:hypothetical protein